MKVIHRNCLEKIIDYDSDTEESIDSFYRQSLIKAEEALRRAETELPHFKNNSEMCLRDVIRKAFRVHNK